MPPLHLCDKSHRYKYDMQWCSDEVNDMRKFFDYHLPEGFIAQYPLKEREKARLMVIKRKGEGIEEGNFTDAEGYLRGGDVLVLNDTKVIPARLWGVKETGGRVEIFLLRKNGAFIWEVLVRGKVREGQSCRLEDKKNPASAAGVTVKIAGRTESGSYMAEFSTDSEDEIFRLGETPLPPYIKRSPAGEDKDYYQTVYADKKGAVAAPTAGLHFTKEMLGRIEKKGVKAVYVTLHIGWASFKILKNENNAPGAEYMEIPEETANAINSAKKSGGRIFAVGTSVVRALESSLQDGRIVPGAGYTDLFIQAGFDFRAVDALITNFHLPGSTHLFLVCAFAGVDLTEKAYNTAVEKKYRFYSYGDAMLIL